MRSVSCFLPLKKIQPRYPKLSNCCLTIQVIILKKEISRFWIYKTLKSHSLTNICKPDYVVTKYQLRRIKCNINNQKYSIFSCKLQKLFILKSSFRLQCYRYPSRTLLISYIQKLSINNYVNLKLVLVWF